MISSVQIQALEKVAIEAFWTSLIIYLPAVIVYVMPSNKSVMPSEVMIGGIRRLT